MTTVGKYVDDPSTRVCVAVMRVDGQDYYWMPGMEDEAKRAFAKLAEGRVLCAHNAPFDAAIWKKFVGTDVEWLDTLPVCRQRGLPGKLDAVGQQLFGRGKDPVGKRLIDMLSKVKIRNGEPQYPNPPNATWELFAEYCKRDVDLLEKLYDVECGHVYEPDVLAVDRKINERGIPVDVDVLSQLADLAARSERESGDKFDEYTNGINPRSSKQVMAWLESCGIKVDSTRKQTIMHLVQNPADFYCDPDDPPDDETLEAVMALLKLREDSIRVGGAKIAKALSVVEDGRLRDQLVYGAAHTWRWGGRAFQPHNLPHTLESSAALLESGKLDFDSVKQLVADGEKGFGYVVNSLIRTAVRAEHMSVADFGAVEARFTAWLADERRLMESFDDPERDVYSEYSEVMYGRRFHKPAFEREVAKYIILGCGFGMSAIGFKRCFDNYFIQYHMHKRGFSMLSEDDAKRFIELYRATYPNIPKLWRAYNDAAYAAVAGKTTHAGKCTFRRDGNHLVIDLPSGRPMVYRDARLVEMVPGWARYVNYPVYARPTLVYRDPRGYDKPLYGGLLTENVAQACSRDLLAEFLVHAEDEKMAPCFHVHDEGGCETDRLDDMCVIMSTPPDWALGLSVLVDGYCGPYWTKHPGKSFRKRKAFNGRLL